MDGSAFPSYYIPVFQSLLFPYLFRSFALFLLPVSRFSVTMRRFFTVFLFCLQYVTIGDREIKRIVRIYVTFYSAFLFNSRSACNFVYLLIDVFNVYEYIHDEKRGFVAYGNINYVCNS